MDGMSLPARLRARFRLLRMWVMDLKPVRVVMHFLAIDGNLLSAGMSFQAMFALFAALYVGFAVTAVWLNSSPEVYQALIDLINGLIPGLIGDIISEDQLPRTTSLTWTGAIALVGLLWTAIGWLNATRQALRAVFTLPRDPRPFVLQKVWDLALALAVGVTLLASAAATVSGNWLLNLALDAAGAPPESIWHTIGGRSIGVVISIVLNTVILAALFRILAHTNVRFRELLSGSLLGAIALAALSLLAGTILDGAGRNPLLATFAVFAGLLLWLNLVSRVILIAGSWVAITSEDRQRSVSERRA